MAGRDTDQQKLAAGELAINLLRGVITAAVYTRYLPVLPRQSIRSLLDEKGILYISSSVRRK